MIEWHEKPKATNAIFLDESTPGKGRYFKARFLETGLVKYSFGVCLLTKEAADRFVYNFVGCPVVIDHKDVTEDNKKESVQGNICNVWFEPLDSWFWCDGIIDGQEAIDCINDGYNVSCQYEITEYADNTTGELHNGNEYGKTILNGKPEHLAIVKNPRYENALIAVNAINKNAATDPQKEAQLSILDKFSKEFKSALTKEAKAAVAELRAKNNTTDKNGDEHDETTGQYTEKNKDDNYSYKAQESKMIELEMSEAEFLETVSKINTVYHSKYKNKKKIKHHTSGYIYKAENHGFNNYKFYDKIINEDIDKGL